MAHADTSKALLRRLKQAHWSTKVLFGLLGATVITVTTIAIWIALLPDAPVHTDILPQYASTQTGQKRFPINLPEPAAGQNAVTVPLQLPPQPAQTAADTAAPGARAEDDAAVTRAIAPPAAKETPPRTLLAELIDTENDQTLPVVAPSGLTSFDAYSAPNKVPNDDDRARIALIFTGIGLNSARSETVLETMPPAMSIAVSPYAQVPQRWADEAMKQGREVLVMVPMEPNSFPTVDPGPDTLLRDAPTIQTLQRLHTVLGKFQGYVGLINDTGSRFTANEVALGPVLDDVAKRGIMIVDARASAYSVMASQAKKRRIPIAVNTRFVDSSLTPNDIDRQLRDLQRTAQTIGAAVGILRDFPVTVERVQSWQQTLDPKEFILVPISAVANRQSIR